MTNDMPRPFSSKSYKRHASDAGTTACALCGKHVADKPGRQEVHVVDGGSRFAAMDENYQNESADMGWFYLGPDCARKVPATHRREA